MKIDDPLPYPSHTSLISKTTKPKIKKKKKKKLGTQNVTQNLQGNLHKNHEFNSSHGKQNSTEPSPCELECTWPFFFICKKLKCK